VGGLNCSPPYLPTMTIHEMRRRVKAVNLNKIGASIVVDHKEDVVQKNREQLLRGEDKTESKLNPKYANKSYSRRKNQRNPFAGLGTPDLYDTGSFQESFKLRMDSEKKYTIFATDEKTSRLIKKYGKNILGIAPKSNEEMRREFFMPELRNGVAKELFR
jgi:hypothetical protein